MTAAELRAILAHVPDDTVVTIDGRSHVRLVKREGSVRVPIAHTAGHCETGRCRLAETEWVTFPDHITLWADRNRRTTVDAPPIELRGPFRRRKELDAELNALDPMPAPEADQ